MSNKKCQYCGRPLAGDICPAHGYVGNPIPATAKGDTGAQGGTGVAPTGAEMMWPVATPPTGWLIEDGSSQLIASYPDLSALIRGTYGGADASHFTLPSLSNRVPAGAGVNAVGSVVGSNIDNGVTWNLGIRNFVIKT